MKQHSIRKGFLWGIISVIALYGVVNRLLYFSPGLLERSSSYCMYPILVTQRTIVTPLKQFFDRRRTVSELTAALEKLKLEHSYALQENIELNALLDYHTNIEELVDFKKRYTNHQGIIAQVLTKQFSEQSHYFLIDAGERKGIKPDMVAIYNNCLIGRVVEVYPLYSKIVLITDKSCKVAASCAKTKSLGIYCGTNDLVAGTLTQVSHLDKIQHDDLLLSSGEGLVFPRGFALGKIRSYHTPGLFHMIVTEPLVDMRTIHHCHIIERDGSYSRKMHTL